VGFPIDADVNMMTRYPTTVLLPDRGTGRSLAEKFR
jgi:hypothetical protein